MNNQGRETRLRRAAAFLNDIDSGCNEVKTLRELIAQAEAAPAAEAVASIYHFQWREIGESGWKRCDYARFLYCEKSPEHDTRVVEAAPPHDAELVELLRDCYPGCGLTTRQTMQIRERIDTYLATLPRT